MNHWIRWSWKLRHRKDSTGDSSYFSCIRTCTYYWWRWYRREKIKSSWIEEHETSGICCMLSFTQFILYCDLTLTRVCHFTLWCLWFLGFGKAPIVNVHCYKNEIRQVLYPFEVCAHETNESLPEPVLPWTCCTWPINMLGSCARAVAPYYLIDTSEYWNVDADSIFLDPPKSLSFSKHGLFINLGQKIKLSVTWPSCCVSYRSETIQAYV